MSWCNHINNVVKKASSTLGLLRRNLRHCPAPTRRTAYISLVRSTMEYASTIWDPCSQGDIDKLERVQRKAARFAKKDYKSRTPGCVTNMLKDLDLSPLSDRRRHLRLILLFKIAEGMVPAIPASSYLTPQREKRQIRAKVYKDCVTNNPVTKYETKNQRSFQIPVANTDTYRNSFFVKTIIDWNQLDNITTSASTLESFKTRLLPP